MENTPAEQQQTGISKADVRIPLHINKELMKVLESFTAKLNDKPLTTQKTPDGKAQYIPIGIIETELSKDFAGLVQYEVISERRELNEYIVHARIKVFHPVIMQWISYDGIGVSLIMQNKDTSIDQFTSAKKPNALEMNAPKAYSEAIKNAAKKIGKKYGQDINRKFEDEYEPIYSGEEERERIKEQIIQCKTIEELTAFRDSYPDMKDNEKFRGALNARAAEIKSVDKAISNGRK